MKEQFSMNREGHMMTTPRSLHDTVFLADREAFEVEAHREGAENALIEGMRLMTEAIKSTRDTSPDAASVISLNRAAVAAGRHRYLEALAVAVFAMKSMERSFEAAHDALEQAEAAEKSRTARR